MKRSITTPETALFLQFYLMVLHHICITDSIDFSHCVILILKILLKHHTLRMGLSSHSGKNIWSKPTQFSPTDKVRLILRMWTDHSFIRLACAECDHSLPFSRASAISLCYVLFPATLLHQLFFHPLSPHLAIYFLVYLSISSFPNSYIISFWEFYFLPFSVRAQTIISI